jgi:hypothetical protein
MTCPQPQTTPDRAFNHLTNTSTKYHTPSKLSCELGTQRERCCHPGTALISIFWPQVSNFAVDAILLRELHPNRSSLNQTLHWSKRRTKSNVHYPNITN